MYVQMTRTLYETLKYFYADFQSHRSNCSERLLEDVIEGKEMFTATCTLYVAQASRLIEKPKTVAR